MRPLALLATVLTCAAANAAGAEALTLKIAPLSDTRVSDALALTRAAFAPGGAGDTVDPISSLIERETYRPGAAPVRWSTGQAALSRSGDTALRVSVGGALRTPGGRPSGSTCFTARPVGTAPAGPPTPPRP